MKINLTTIFSFVLFLINVLLSQLFYTDNNSLLLSSILIFIDILFIAIIFFKKKNDKNVYFVILISLIIRVFLLYFELYGRNIFLLPNSGSDTEAFYNYALVRDWNQLNGYFYFVKILYKLFNNQRLLFQFVNVIFSVIVDIIILKILKILNVNNKNKLFAMVLLCFLPSNMIISVELLREELMILLNTISLYYFVKWYVNNKTLNFIISIMFILLSAYFHSSIIVAILSYFIVYVLYDRNQNKLFINRKSLLYLFIILIVALFIYRFIFPYVNSYFNSISDLESINKKMSYYINGGSGYLQNLAYNKSYISLIITSPLKFIYFFASPMPWDWRGIADILTFSFSSIFYIYVFVLFFKNKNRANAFVKSLMLVIIIVGLIYGMSCFSAGAAMRHREKILPYAIVLIAYIKKINNDTNAVNAQ